MNPDTAITLSNVSLSVFVSSHLQKAAYISSRMSRAVQEMPQPTIRGTEGMLVGPMS